MKKLLLASLMLPVLAAHAQTKKVILEDFTGAWCQFCPNGSKGIEDLEVQYPTNFLPVASHTGDALAIPEGLAVKTGINVTGVPAGAIDRKIISGGVIPIGINGQASQWKSAVATRVTQTAIASISFANAKLMPSGAYEADIKVKFTGAAATGVPINVQVYIIEDKIEATVANGLDQTNSTVHYGGGNPLTTANGFYHDNTLRMALGGDWGFTGVVPMNPTIGTEYTKHISFTVPTTGTVPSGTGWNKSNVHVYAFVAYDGAASADRKEVLNAEEMQLSSFFPLSVETPDEEVSVVSVYPNPARATDIVKVEYNVKESSNVTMKVFNAAGQLVAKPYDSYEVRGLHTIHWRPSESGVAAGIYTIEVSNPEGSVTQKVVVQ